MATIMPKNTPVPIECLLAEPGPEAITIGSIPNTNARDVIVSDENGAWRPA